MQQHARTDHLGRDVVLGRKLPGGVLRYAAPPARPSVVAALLGKAAQQVMARLFSTLLVPWFAGVRAALRWAAAPALALADVAGEAEGHAGWL